MAAQLIARKLLSLMRQLWMARATSSFPDPLSPVIITGTSLAATRPIILKTCCAIRSPTISS